MEDKGRLVDAQTSTRDLPLSRMVADVKIQVNMVERKVAEINPKTLFADLEYNLRIIKIEDPKFLTMCLRYVVRHLHPRGKKIKVHSNEAIVCKSSDMSIAEEVIQ